MSTHLAMPHPVYGHPPTYSGLGQTSVSTFDHQNDIRNISRTPSPTLEEYNALHGIKKEKTITQKIIYYSIIALIITIAVLISVYSTKIVNALQPETSWMRDHPAGPLIPIAILIVLSFPPLFGQEIVGMLVGVTWDLWPAFAIVSLGTLLGETANFLTFKYACTARSKKIEEKNLDYGLMVHIVRSGGLLMLVVIRYSAVPSHYATAVFSSVGIPFFVFLLSAFLSLPNQFVPVYTGYALKPSESNDKTSKVVQDVVLVAGIVITTGAYIWVKRQLKTALPEYIYQRRKARQAKLELGGGPGPQAQHISLPNV
ncbi:hypothetical protein GGX14DRAFT_396136 [Mycena pura]|uniref:Golgi apparatus membrane protein TVP38 n=1 Tax=Mycena pura TaxID=153505 RepID=A0AAD6VB54_9AGAR|nr:hypothetical protein GGX14DRAFT_396136 [Mycena pura]